MKKNLMKKVFAVSLSIAMACSFLPATNPVTASAAAPYVGLRTTFKTLKVNQSTKMTLKNNSLNWQVNKVTTSAKAIATVYGKDKKAATFNIKGKSVGRATIKATLKTTARKTKNTKTVSCRVKVVANETPVTPTSPTEATVKTQAELEATIKSLSETGNTINKITIATDAEENFTIPAGSFLGVDLVVNAPKSDVTNNATFRTIEIQAIKDTTWTENSTGNKLTVSAISARIVVSSGASVDSIVLNKADAAIAIVVDGTVASIVINQKAAVAISGASTAKTKVAVNATDATLTASAPVEVTATAKATIVLEKGAEGSTVTISTRDVTVSVDNRTNGAVTVTKADGTEQNLPAGQKQDFLTIGGGTTPVNPSTPGSSNTTTGSAIQARPDLTTISASATGTVTTGSAVYVTSGSITITADVTDLFKQAENITGASIVYTATVDGKPVKSETTVSETNKTIEFTTDISNKAKGATVKVILSVNFKTSTSNSVGTNKEYSFVIANIDETAKTITFSSSN